MNRNIVLPYQFDPEYTDEEMAERAKGTQSQRVADTDSSSEEEDSYDSWESFGDPYSDDEPFIYEGSDEELQGAVCYMQDPLFGTKPYQYEPTYKKGDKMPKEDPVIKQLKEKLTRERIVNSDWCTCGMCIVFKSPGECVCCQELKEVDSFREHGSCITEHEEFETVCLSQLNLRISYLESVNPYTDRKPREPDEGQIYRKYQELSYQRFKRWIYWRLPKDMIPIPSCVRYRIQEAFPSDEICGFRHVKHMIGKK